VAQSVSASPRVLADADALADTAADRVLEHARRAIRARGAFRIAVPGGRSPRGMLERLAAPPRAGALEWPHVTVLLADERALPANDPERNSRLLEQALLAPLGSRAPRFLPIAAERTDLESAASEYEPWLEEPLDLLVLGVGEDGHVASLFPGSKSLSERERRVAVIHDSPKPPPSRVTLTPRSLAEARAILVIASGADKAAAVAAALASGVEPGRVPAALARRGEWLLDREAASALTSGAKGAR
jgi:6-phosphogluconolactonase